MVDRKLNVVADAAKAKAPSQQEFAIMGLHSVAYVRWNETRPEAISGGVDMPESGYSIHAANGQMIGWAPNLDMAHLAIRQHDLAPVTVH